MKKYVVTVEPELTISDAAKIMSNNRIGSVVVTKGQKAIGIVTTEDITGVVARGLDPKRVKISELKREKFVTTSPKDNILDVTRFMVKSGVKRVPVVENGKLVGIISDKEILATSPELIDVLSEKLKARMERVAKPDELLSGICEECGAYSDELENVAGRWLCEECNED
ncbi:MAG: CBS domain-containing protein [Candidatus Aenigmatarchaeota archaeon]